MIFITNLSVIITIKNITGSPNIETHAHIARLQYDSREGNELRLVRYNSSWQEKKLRINPETIEEAEFIEQILVNVLPKNIGLAKASELEHSLKHSSVNFTPKSGFLVKQGGNNKKSWQKRWFSLENGVATYYISEKMRRRKGHFEVSGGKVIENTTVKGKSNTFALRTEARTFNLEASSPQDKKSWIRAFTDHGAVV